MQDQDKESFAGATGHGVSPQDSTPSISATSRCRQGRLWASLAVCGIVLILVTAILARSFGSLPAALHYLRGDRLFPEPSRLRVGPLEVGKPVTTYTEVHNYTSKSVHLLGANYRCTCVIAKDLPATIPAGATYRLPLVVQALADKPVIDESITIFTDSQERPQIVVHVLGSARR